MAKPVIGGALVAVLENLVGLVDFLETNFAGGIARILVRMPFHRQLAERRLELGIVRGPLDFESFVVAALGGHQFKSARSSSSSRSNAPLENAASGLTKNDPQSSKTRRTRSQE